MVKCASAYTLFKFLFYLRYSFFYELLFFFRATIMLWYEQLYVNGRFSILFLSFFFFACHRKTEVCSINNGSKHINILMALIFQNRFWWGVAVVRSKWQKYPSIHPLPLWSNKNHECWIELVLFCFHIPPRTNRTTTTQQKIQFICWCCCSCAIFIFHPFVERISIESICMDVSINFNL